MLREEALGQGCCAENEKHGKTEWANIRIFGFWNTSNTNGGPSSLCLCILWKENEDDLQVKINKLKPNLIEEGPKLIVHCEEEQNFFSESGTTTIPSYARHAGHASYARYGMFAILASLFVPKIFIYRKSSSSCRYEMLCILVL